MADILMYGNEQIGVAGPADASELPYDSTKSTKEKIDAVNQKDYAQSSTFLSVNDTWQIPSAVWNHTFILIGIRRQGLGGYMLIDRNEVSLFDNSLTIPALSGNYYNFKISSTGLFTLTGKSSGVNEPVIMVRGFL